MNQHLPVGTKATEHRLVANVAYPEDPSLSNRPSKVQAWHLERRAIVYIRQSTPHRWIKLGWIHSRRLPGLQGTVICWADAEELKRLRKLRHARHGWWDPPWPAELTTPKPRP